MSSDEKNKTQFEMHTIKLKKTVIKVKIPLTTIQ
jgi:hypothetical protein